METTEIHYAYLHSDHVKELCALYKTIFNKFVTPDYFMIKYGLYDPEKIQFGTVALLNGKVIGLYGSLLQEFRNDDSTQRLLLLQGCDYFVIRSHRKGVVTKCMFEHTAQLAHQHGINHMYGFQSNQSYNRCKSLGFTDGSHFVRFHLPIGSKYTAGIIRKTRLEWLKIMQLERLIRKHKSIEALRQLNRVEGRFTNHFAADFFKQKTFCKHYQLELNGCVLYIKYDRILSVGLCYFTENAEPEQLVRSLKRLARRCLIDEIVFHLQGNSKEAQIMQAYLPAQPSFKISSYLVHPSTTDFSSVQLHYMDMDVF